MAVLAWAGSFQTPYRARSRPGPAMYHPLTHSPGERIADIFSCAAMFSHRLLLSYPLRMGSRRPRVQLGGGTIYPFGDL